MIEILEGTSLGHVAAMELLVLLLLVIGVNGCHVLSAGERVRKRRLMLLAP